MNNICISAEHLSKTFFVPKKRGRAFGVLRSLLSKERFSEDLCVLHDINFEIDKGEKVALIGENGAGKTTLLRILCGVGSDNVAGRGGGERVDGLHPRKKRGLSAAQFCGSENPPSNPLVVRL